MAHDKPAAAPKRGFLMRLLADERGNTMAMMTAGIVPMIGLVGGALDMSRMYLVKARIQQACDAGALAGRKRMGAGAWNQASGAPNTVALNFFDSNFADEAYGTTGRTRAFSESAGRVTGTASATVPMTLMKVFNKQQEVIQVSCDAEMRLPNTDIMFVLDTTGSMGGDAGGGQTRIQALRTAVKCFYQVVAKLDSNQDCAGDEPSGGTPANTQIRFGFVPYATNVNVGRLLPTNFFADEVNYHTRRAEFRQQTFTETDPAVSNPGSDQQTNDQTTQAAWQNNPSGNGSQSFNGRNYRDVSSVPGNCNATPANDPIVWGAESGPQGSTPNSSTSSSTSGNTTTTTTTTTTTWTTTQTGTEYDYDKASLFGTCYTGYWRTRVHTRTRSYSRTDTTTQVTRTITRNVFNNWHYASHPVDVRPLKSGTSWNAGFAMPIGDTADGAETVASKQITWDGCIEERATVSQANYNPIPTGARDLDINTAPVAGEPDSLWRPALPDLFYHRQIRNGDGTLSNTISRDEQRYANNSFTMRGNNQIAGYYCPNPARNMQTWPAANAFDAYVDGLAIDGNTHHDIGLLWGARLISPNGIFSAQNAQTPAGGAIERHIVFMTDGEACTDQLNYAAYGMAYYDRRTTASPSGGCNPNGTLTTQVNERYAAICRAVRNQNITLWVVSFAVAETHEAGLRACATPGRFYSAADGAALQTAFTAIAAQIAQLRLTN